MPTSTKSGDKKSAGAKATKGTAARTDGAHKTVQPSPELAAVVGEQPLKRTEVVSKVWDYIKKKDLQNPANRREILADANLEKVFGKKSVTMFEMNKHLSNHLK
ncbi:MAG: SWIB/MDM2 domain-containing protein [Novosphingobium sp.]